MIMVVLDGVMHGCLESCWAAEWRANLTDSKPGFPVKTSVRRWTIHLSSKSQ